MENRARSLAFAVAPALVLFAALFLFEAAATELPALTDRVASSVDASAADARDEARIAAELRARVLWSAAALLFLASAAATAMVSLSVLRGVAAARDRRAIWVAFAALFGAELVVGLGEVATATEQAYSLGADALRALSRADVLLPASFVVNLVAAAVPALGLVAGCACAVAPSAQHAPRLDDLAERMRRLEQILHLGSAMLATGVLHILLWSQIAAALPGVPPNLADSIDGAATTVSLFWGAAYSALIAALYVPASRSIADAARRAAERERGDAVAAGEALRERGLIATPMSRVPQIASMLGPLVAGPIGALAAEIAKSAA